MHRLSFTDLPKLAMDTIKYYLEHHEIRYPEDIDPALKEERGVFVTLEKHGQLRGCIGNFGGVPIYKGVVDNAINAAFHDPRFDPVSEGELDSIKVEVSVLSSPRPLSYENPDDLLSKLKPSYGVILHKGMHSATFLPQVWEDLPDKIDFLEHLAIKAGLDKDAWKTAKYEVYQVKAYK